MSTIETQNLWTAATLSNLSRKIGQLEITFKDDAVGSVYIQKVLNKFNNIFENDLENLTLELMNLTSILHHLENYEHTLDIQYLVIIDHELSVENS